MRPMIEPAAGRLFDIYYQYTSKSDLGALQSITEEAYKLHERLKRFPGKKHNLFDLDEFLLLKALRHYSVHQDDFVGKAYAVEPAFARKHSLDLLRVCLVDKKVVRLALNAEAPLKHGEQEKTAKINKQLVDFGDYYNIEPVIFNFMVKVYEKLVGMGLSIPGSGFSEIDKAYKNEIYHNYPHFISLETESVKNEDVLANILPLEDINIADNQGLVAESDDPFNKVTVLDIDYQNIEPVEYEANDYELMHDTILNKIVSDEQTLMLATGFPKYIGLAFVTYADAEKPSEITGFHIGKQRDKFIEHDIKFDPVYFETTTHELLVLFFNDGHCFPIIIYKSSLLEKIKEHEEQLVESINIDLPELDFTTNINVPKTGSKVVNPFSGGNKKLGRNDPCLCGSGKKFKKCCLH